MTALPKVLVIMPAFNASLFIREAIESVLSQDKVIIDLIVVDDCSSDTTYNIAKTYSNIRVFKNSRNLGNYYSTNNVLYDLIQAKEQWDYYTFHAADDVSAPNRFFKQISLFKPNVLAVGCLFQRVDFRTKKIIYRNSTATESMLIFKKEVLNIIGYRDSGRAGCDTEYNRRLKLARPNSILVVNQFLLSAYSHENNLTKRIPLGGDYRKKYVFEFTQKHQKMKKEKNYYQDFKP